MPSYIANVRNEIDKLSAMRKIRLIVLLTAIVPVMAGLLLGSLNGQTGISFIGAGGAAGLPLLMLDLLVLFWLPPVLFMTAAELFAGEKSTRTMKLVLTKPIARSAVYASKLTAIAALCLLLLGEVWLIAWLTELFTGMGGGSSALGVLHSLGVYAAAFVPMMVLALIAAFVVQWFGSGTGAFLILLFFYLAGKLLPLVYPSTSGWNVFAQTDWYRLWLGNLPSLKHAMTLFMFLLAHGIMSYAAGWYRFEKQSF
ncbi:ABC transporter permease [Paenibacillus methanolicus]|uniref:ABC-2 type transport system permease protein n=1 Tax=Paenibacillus methanolicus TaxID=582686 RepID=A0A5S5CJU3_9BACL|nr:ABC transporter permease [Paenibacillus methanolicus]TYP79177.1 ABC-2 type transport system permease protein [Paenibacillus methanolicus]